MRVQAPDGKVIEFPESMSADQVGAAMRTQYPPTPVPAAPKPTAPTVPERPFGLPRIPSPFEVADTAQAYLKKGPTELFRLAGKADVASGIKSPATAEKRAQQYGSGVTELAEAALLPVSRAKSLGSAILKNAPAAATLAGLQTPGDLAQKAKGAAGGALGSGVGTVLGRGGALLRSGADMKTLGTDLAKKTATALTKQVPAWSSLPTDTEGLYRMAHEDGGRLLDRMIKSTKALIPETLKATIPETLAGAAKIKGLPPMAASTPKMAAGANPTVDVEVAVRDLYERLPEIRRLGWKAHNQAWTAIEEATKDIPAIQATRQAYKTGMGWIEFAEKGKIFNTDHTLDPLKAAEAVKDIGKKTLLNRDMGDIHQLAKTAKDVTATKIGPWTKKLVGAGAGELVGTLAGFPHGISGLGGALAGEAALPSTIYQNVPAGRLTQLLQRLLHGGGTETGRLAAEALVGKSQPNAQK